MITSTHEIKLIGRILVREFYMSFRSRNELFNPIIFFVIVISLFPLAISPEPAILTSIAPGIIWVAALLAIIISLDKLFKSDFEDGSLEHYIVSRHSLIVIAFAKVFSYWLLMCVPLLVILPLICLMYALPIKGVIAIFLSLLLGTPTLYFLGAIGSALTVGLRNSSILLTSLMLPFYIPVLIFGATTATFALSGVDYAGQLAFLGAFLILAITACPFAIAAALRISVNY